MQMYLTWGPSSKSPPPFSLILLYVSQHRLLTAFGQKKASSYSLVFTRDTCRDGEKSSGLAHYLNYRSHYQNLRSTQVKLSLLHRISLKIDHKIGLSESVLLYVLCEVLR